MISAVIKGTYKCYWFDKKCKTTVSSTDKASTIIPTSWQNLYFKEHTAIVGLSGITPQI